MKFHHEYTNSAKLLGERLEQYRKLKGMTSYALGRQINIKEQQILKYEKGGLVPLRTLEQLADALHVGVEKKIIRRISFLRKLEDEKGEVQPDLSYYYNEIFPEIDNTTGD